MYYFLIAELILVVYLGVLRSSSSLFSLFSLMDKGGLLSGNYIGISNDEYNNLNLFSYDSGIIYFSLHLRHL